MMAMISSSRSNADMVHCKINRAIRAGMSGKALLRCVLAGSRNSGNRTKMLASLALFSCMALAACSGDRRAVPGPYAPVADAALGQSRYSVDIPTDYRLAPNDVVQLKVYGEPDLSFERLSISQRGTLNLPFVGEARASGLTTAELARDLRHLLGRHLREPQISVNLVEYGSQRITVEGSVTHSGVFTIQPGTTLLGALALAGEPDRLGKVRQIVVIRTDPDGRSLALFDLRAMRAGTMIDPVLQGNDRVVVGTSGLSRAYQDFLSLIPAAAIFTRL
jgi:polysaccharide export outer membrane protein